MEEPDTIHWCTQTCACPMRSRHPVLLCASDTQKAAATPDPSLPHVCDSKMAHLPYLPLTGALTLFSVLWEESGVCLPMATTLWSAYCQTSGCGVLEVVDSSGVSCHS